MRAMASSDTCAATSTALLAKLFRGFADTSRLAILALLCEEPRTVGELAEASGLSQPNVSNHLACLRECGLVERERSGRQVTYRAADPRVPALLSLAEELMGDIGANIYACTRYRRAEGSPGDD